MTGAADEDLHGGGQIGLLKDPPSSQSVLPSIASLLTGDDLSGSTPLFFSVHYLYRPRRPVFLVNTGRRTGPSSKERIEVKMKVGRDLMRNACI